jgi:hypothetical protein
VPFVPATRASCSKIRSQFDLGENLRRLHFTLQLVCLSCAAGASGQTSTPTASVPPANPGRPTVSTPATLTPVGYLQFESGTLGAAESIEFDSRFGINEVVKLTVMPRLELILQTEPFVGSTTGSSKARHSGDVFTGLQAVLFPGKRKRPTVSVSYFRSVYASPAADIDIGSFRQSGILLVSNDVWGFHFDGNAIVSEQVDGAVRRAQFGQTLSVSHPLRRFTFSGEIWHFTQPILNSNAIGNLWAAAYAVRDNLVLDVGFDRGLTRTSTQWEAFVGFTYLLPRRLWKER